jgi:uncharacterized DUF497 family protein
VTEFDFDWDAGKAARNVRKHGITFDEAKTVFEDPNARPRFDYEHSTTEERWRVVGLSRKLRLLSVIYAKSDETTIRIISARRATKAETGSYAVEG